METMEAAADLVGEGRGGLCWQWSPREQLRRWRPPTAAAASFGVDKLRFMAVLRLPVVGLTTLLSIVVLGALVVAFETWVGCLVQFVIICVV